MIYTWAADVAPLLDPIIYEAYYREVPQWRQEKADRIRFSEDRALSIGAYVLYQKALRESGLSTEMCFNLSHSGHYVLCSIADEKEKRTGCDLEKIGTPGMKVARRFFCSSEWQYIREQESGEEQTEAFYRYLVLKESFMKATRFGMKLPLDSFEIRLKDEGAPVLVRMPEHIRGEFYFHEYPQKEKVFFAAVCSEDPEIDDMLRWMTL